MKCVLFGEDNTAPSTSVVQYGFLSSCFSSSWNSTENTRTVPISEQITITAFNVYLDTAPGTLASGKKYTFAIRDDGADALSGDISETATVLNWTGSAVISINSLVAIAATPVNTPTASTNIYWHVYYTTAGQSFIMMGSNTNNAATGATNYSNLAGGIGTAWATTDTDYDILVPSAGTLTALSVASPAGNMGGAVKQYALTVNRNNGTSDMTATMVNTDVAATATGSVAWTAGDRINIKAVPTSTPTGRRLGWCISVTPTTNGETFCGFGAATVPSASATNFEQMNGNGNNGWNSSESVRYCKPPAVIYKNLYIQTTNPSPGNRTITFMDNTVASALTANVAAGSTTANDTTHSVTFSAAGNTGTFRSTVAATPAASTGWHIGYVMFIAQGIAFDAAGNSGDIAAASSYSGSASWSGTNRCLSVDVSMLGAGVTVTAMTYGGAVCTFVGKQATVTSLGSVEQWRIVSSDSGAPAAGSNTLAVTLSGSIEFTVEWVSYTNVHQTSPTEGFNSAQATNVGSATDASVTITTVADNDWVHAAVVANDTSISAGNTTRNNISGTLGSGANEDNGAPKTPAGTVAMSYSGMGITTTWAIAGYALRDINAASLVTSVTFKSMMGLGQR